MDNIIIINTNNFKLEYINKKYKYIYKNEIIIEIYRSNLFIKLQKKLLKYYNKYLQNILKKNPLYDITDRKKYFSIEYATDLLSIFIFNHKFNSNLDIIFDDISPFNKITLYNYIERDNCININKSSIKIIYKIFPKLSFTYIKYYKKLENKLNFLYNIKYDIIHENINNEHIITLDIKKDDTNFLNKIVYENKLIIPNHIFIHLIKLFNTNILNNYISAEILDNVVIEYIYILFNRYHTFSSGNNQASVLPSFKKFLKTYFNIKIELFGSPLNTSNNNFGSFFYDIDKYFGSLGDFFKINIQRGYYEINPPFDKCLINNIFEKILNELTIAENNKEALLFCLIIPKSYFITNKNIKNKYDIYLNSDKYSIFFKYNILLNKERFPYIRYSRNFKKTIVSSIVDTHILLLHNTHISKYVQNNVNIFKTLLNNWIK